MTSPEHVKCPILATNAMAEYIVLDPLLTVRLLTGLTASTGMDVLAHPWNPTHQRRRLSRQTRSAREIFVRSYNGCLWRCHIRTR
ncbi:hypothetical protein [Ruthenibacterium lactatiformans]|uniref:hypothetical protein n=1 Tax=Ruthenibacterium lactatiformans TaxID=1550024 RepID=UPI00399FEDC2